VLGRRLEAIRQALSASNPIRLGIFTRARPPQDSELHLAFDWQPRFDGRQATAAMWERTLLPSLRTVAEAVSRQHSGRAVVARGQACLPALVALGAAFLEPRKVHLIWQQHMRDSGRVQDWSLRSSPEESGFDVEVVPNDVAAEDIAVCVTFRNTVHQAVKRGQASNDIPRFRAVVDASLPEGHSTVIDSPGRARDAVSKLADGIHAAQTEYPAGGKLHLFMDAPAGFAVMLGQKLNGMGPVQTYEHEQLDGIGRYAPAALLHPGA
jgi:hypothetical protein